MLEQEYDRLRRAVAHLTLGKLMSREAASGNYSSAARRRAWVWHVTARLAVSERFAGRRLGQHRWTQRKGPSMAAEEAGLKATIIDLARQFGRYGYGGSRRCWEPRHGTSTMSTWSESGVPRG